jgi:hypothetical protein
MTPQPLGSRVLARIKEGTAVYDPDGHTIGTVKTVYLGSSEEGRARGTGPATVGDGGSSSPIDFVAASLRPPSPFPDVLRQRLLQHGYLGVDIRFGRDCYVMPEQIAEVNELGVVLNVGRDALITQ